PEDGTVDPEGGPDRPRWRAGRGEVHGPAQPRRGVERLFKGDRPREPLLRIRRGPDQVPRVHERPDSRLGGTPPALDPDRGPRRRPGGAGTSGGQAGPPDLQRGLAEPEEVR